MRKNVLLRVNYPSGRKWMLTVEKDNLRVHTSWYEDGNIMLKSVYNFITNETVQISYYPNGNMCLREVCSGDDVISSENYNEDGTKVER